LASNTSEQRLKAPTDVCVASRLQLTPSCDVQMSDRKPRLPPCSAPPNTAITPPLDAAHDS
jgi:hypothetical protein